MSLIVENGSGLANAESYASVAQGAAHASRYGLTWPSNETAAEQALRRATRYIDATYRLRFIGARTFGRQQALEWPRAGATIPQVAVGYWSDTTTYLELASNTVPVEVISATIEAAVRESGSPGVLSPDIERGGAIKMERAGDTAREYFASSNPSAVFPVIDSVLSGILLPVRLTARASRG